MEGTILVNTLPNQLKTTTADQRAFPTGIIGVDPTNQGAQTRVSTGQLFTLPAYLAEGPTGLMYVTDLYYPTLSPPGPGAVIIVDPSKPDGNNQTLLVSGTTPGSLINGPNILAYVNGYLYVANEADASGTVHTLIRVNPNPNSQSSDPPIVISNGDNGNSTGGNSSTTLANLNRTWTTNQWASWSVMITGGTGNGQVRTVVSNTGTRLTISSAWTTVPDSSSTYELGFTVPVGMFKVPGSNSVYMVDEPGNVQGTDPGKLWKIDLTTGVQTIVTSNNSTQGTLFNHPVDITLGANGLIYILNTGSASNSYVGTTFTVDLQTGIETPVNGVTFLMYSGSDSMYSG